MKQRKKHFENHTRGVDNQRGLYQWPHSNIELASEGAGTAREKSVKDYLKPKSGDSSERYERGTQGH